MALFEELKVFSGTANPKLANDVCDYLGISPGRIEAFKFANDNTFVRFLENVRQRDIYLIQPLCAPVNDNLMELLISIDAAKRASAGRITAVIPFFGYGRTDKKDQPRVPITARLVADMISTAGADRVLTMDLHAGQIQGFFNIPVDELTALTLLAHHFRGKKLENPVVVAVDIGISKRARDMATRINAPLAIIEKRRTGNNDTVESLNIIGDVEGCVAITFDDEIDTGGSILSAISALKTAGVKEIYSAATHGVFSHNATSKLEDSPLREILVTDTIPTQESKHDSKITVLSVAGILGEAIHRIHSGLSVGAMFDQDW